MPDRRYNSDIAFTPSVKALQERFGSRASYAEMEQTADWSNRISDDLASFVAARNSFYLATANGSGQPYIQHRGGPKGFLKVLDERRLGFADFKGNKQYITTGNLSDNAKAFIFLMDYARRQRVKIWGTAEVSEDQALINRLIVPGYRARPERAIVFTVEVWNANCPQHIPLKVEEEDVAEVVAKLQSRIEELEDQVRALRTQWSWF